MWPMSEYDESLSGLGQEELQQRVEMLTDIIELKEGKTPQELHPEMNDEQLCDHLSGLYRFSQSL